MLILYCNLLILNFYNLQIEVLSQTNNSHNGESILVVKVTHPSQSQQTVNEKGTQTATSLQPVINTNNILDTVLMVSCLVCYLIRINFRAYKISRKFARRRPYARNFIRELRAERSCAKMNPREKKSCPSLFF